MVNFNGAYYMYLHNLQGDIVGLVDSGNNIVVEYKYDAWGRPTLKRSLTIAYDTLATLNPFRYRGYIYDEASGLYYLRSRFYNPVWGRFVNSDNIISVFGKNTAYNNLFCYCLNMPIVYCDPSGHSLISMLKNIAYKIGTLLGKEEFVQRLFDPFSPEGAVWREMAPIDFTSLVVITTNVEKITEGERDGERSNAEKHALWSAALTIRFGTDMAKRITDAHEYQLEYQGIDPAQAEWIQLNTEMDFRNNEIGRSIGESVESNITLDELFQIVKGTELYYIVNGDLQPGM